MVIHAPACAARLDRAAARTARRTCHRDRRAGGRPGTRPEQHRDGSTRSTTTIGTARTREAASRPDERRPPLSARHLDAPPHYPTDGSNNAGQQSMHVAPVSPRARRGPAFSPLVEVPAPFINVTARDRGRAGQPGRYHRPREYHSRGSGAADATFAQRAGGPSSLPPRRRDRAESERDTLRHACSGPVTGRSTQPNQPRSTAGADGRAPRLHPAGARVDDNDKFGTHAVAARRHRRPWRAAPARVRRRTGVP
jgi:hypothetical protein